MATPEWGSLPFDEAIAYWRQKVRIPTARWSDLQHGAHVRGFSVAGAMVDSLLADFQAALTPAFADGATLATFRRDFDRIVESHGWEYKGGRNWRSRVIYQTNLSVSYSAGRYAQMTDPDVISYRPFWRYNHSDAQHPRKLHLAWDGLVLDAKDPWWQTRYPPNDWGCGCYVTALSQRQIEKMGMKGPDQPPDDGPPVTWRDKVTGETWQVPPGIGPGWAYSPGQSWLHGTVPPELAKPLPPSPGARPDNLPPLPAPRPTEEDRTLPAGQADEAYVAAFLDQFGGAIGLPVVFRDASGTRIVIADDLFRQRDGTLKASKRGRAASILLLSDAIRDPDEIWLDWFKAKSGDVILRRRYIRAMVAPDGAAPLLSVFEWSNAGWSGVTGFPPDDVGYLEGQRTGALIYRRPTK